MRSLPSDSATRLLGRLSLVSRETSRPGSRGASRGLGLEPRASLALCLLGAGSLALTVMSACNERKSVPTVPQAAKEQAPVSPPTSESQQTRFARAAEDIYWDYLEHHPTRGIELGYHEKFDGKLPDCSSEALSKRLSSTKAAIAQLEAFADTDLDGRSRVDRDILLNALRTDAFDLEARREPWKNPIFYVAPIDLSLYISRDYAPIERRAKALVDVAPAVRRMLEQAKANLEPALPRTWIDNALLQARGSMAFARGDVKQAFSEVNDPALKAELEHALADIANSLEAFAVWLEQRKATATDDFRLGKDRFMAMLAATQGVHIEFAELEGALTRDLERNLAAIEVAAKQIDPKKSVAEVVESVARDKPPADGVLDLAQQQSDELRAFLLERKLVSIPSDDVALVRPTPPFLRWNFAFLDGAGAFEKERLPSFYYISPPNPSWPKAKQAAYVPGTTDLLFVTVHEVWPGHFLHGLHVNQNPSIIARSLWNYAMTEGWAHYGEEMLWEAGFRDDARTHIGQLTNALLRNVRAISALGFHAGDLTVEQSLEAFRTRAFQDVASAEQQALRGTFDPMYLSYTLGKLMVIKLRDDVQRKRGDAFQLGKFHDEFLSYGAAPVPVLRREMLGPDAGPVL